MQHAIVTGLNRKTGQAVVALPEGVVDVPVAILGEIPPPRSVVWVDGIDRGQGRILGIEGPRRFVFHDDFSDVGIGFPLVNNSIYAGDTNWTAKVGVAGNGTLLGDNTVGTGDNLDLVGVSLLGTGASASQWATLMKDGGASAAAHPMWVSGRVSLFATANVVARIGMGDVTQCGTFASAAGFRAVELSYDNTISANWTLLTGNGAGLFNFTDTGVPAVTAEYRAFDLLWVPGFWAGLWLDGALVATSVTNIPPAAGNFPVMIQAFPRAASAVGIRTDFVRQEVIGSVSLP